jgi:hypothetical protein
VLQGYQQNQVQQGVAQVMSDTSISEDKKPGEIFKKFGNSGIEVLAKMNALQKSQGDAIQSLAKGKLADMYVKSVTGEGGGGVTGGASGNVIDTMAQMYGVNVTPEQRGVLQQQYTQALLAGEKNPMAAIEPLLRGAAGAEKRSFEVKELQQKVRQGEEQGPLKTEKLKQEVTQGAAQGPLKTQKLQQEVKAAEPVEVTPESIKAAFPKMSTEQAQAAALAANTGGKKALATTVEKNVNATQPQPTRVQEADLGAKSAEYAATLTKFTEKFLANPETGLLTGASIKAWADKHGVPFNDPNLLYMLEAQHQAVAQQARGGSMFMSSHSIALANDIIPTVGRSPLSNLTALNLIADQQIKLLTVRRTALEGTRQSTAPLDLAIKDWENLKGITGSLDTYITSDKQHTVVMFQGNQINPSNLKTIFEGGAKKYKVDNNEIDGATVLQNASMVHVTPEQWLAAAQAHVGQ